MEQEKKKVIRLLNKGDVLIFVFGVCVEVEKENKLIKKIFEDGD